MSIFFKKRPHLIVQSSANSTLGATFLIQKRGDLSLIASTIVILWFLAALGEEQDSWESWNVVFLADGVILLGVGVDVGNDTLYALTRISEKVVAEY